MIRQAVRGLVALTAAALCLTGPAGSTQAADTAPYAFDWKGSPAAPQIWTGAGGWDVLVHRRGSNNGSAMDPLVAQHGADCSAPPATHVISNMDEGVYICHDHVMTSVVDGGYGAIVLTPDHMVDFASGESVVSFATTTLHTNARDYIDLWVTPFADNLMAPLDDAVDLQGPPRNAVHVTMCECFNGQTTFTASVYNNFKETKLPQASGTPAESVLQASSVTRTPFELHLTQNHIKFGLPMQNLWWVDTSMPALSWSRGVVQVMDHAYNSCKDQVTDASHPCASGDTWHWSQFRISSAVPFSIINGDNRYLGADFKNEVVNFPVAAPANAFLRFEAMGSNIEWSADGGHSWTVALRQSIVGDKGNIHDEHFSPYFTPIPAGTKSITLQGSSGWFGPWEVRDPALWSTEAVPEEAAAPAPTAAAAQPPAPAPSAVPHHQVVAPRKAGFSLTAALTYSPPADGLALLLLVAVAGGLYLRGRRRRGRAGTTDDTLPPLPPP